MGKGVTFRTIDDSKAAVALKSPPIVCVTTQERDNPEDLCRTNKQLKRPVPFPSSLHILI